MIIRKVPLKFSDDLGLKNVKVIDISSVDIDLPQEMFRPVFVCPEYANLEVDDYALIKLIWQKLKDLEGRISRLGMQK